MITVEVALPGVRREDVGLKLGVCPHSHVKQLTVTGKPNISLLYPDEGGLCTMDEIKYGEYKRVLVVPFETADEDIDMTLEDGILTLTMPGGTTLEGQEMSESPVTPNLSPPCT